MKSRLGSALLLTVLLSLGAVAPVSAHVLRSDKNINVEMHIPPDDQVIATKPTTLEFEFEDEPATFSLVECGCSLQVTGANDVALTSSLQLNRSMPNQLTTQVTFPKTGNYIVRLTGATASGDPEQFSVAYDVVAKPVPVTINRTARNVSIILVDICTLAIVVFTIYYLYYRPKQRARHGDDRHQIHKTEHNKN